MMYQDNEKPIIDACLCSNKYIDLIVASCIFLSAVNIKMNGPKLVVTGV